MLWGIWSRDLGCSPRGVWGIGEVREKNQRDIVSFHLIGWVAVLREATLLASQPMFSPLRPHRLVKPPWRSLLQSPLTLPCLWGLTVPEASGDSGMGWTRGRSTPGGMRPSPDILGSLLRGVEKVAWELRGEQRGMFFRSLYRFISQFSPFSC